VTTIKLKNGQEESDVLVFYVMKALRRLIEENPIAFYELVTKFRDSRYKPFGKSLEVLKAAGLLYATGNVHGSIKNIVLSAVTGEGFEMTLGSPVDHEVEA
jgi:hypothetical protein